MSEHPFLHSRGFLRLLAFLAGFALPVAAAAEVRLSESYGKLPLHFEANQGQTHKDVRFLARGPGYGLYLTADEAVLVLTGPSPDENGKRNARASSGARAKGQSVALRMSLVGAARQPLVSGRDELPGRANYFVGKDQSKWRTDVPTYAKVHYREVYPGIDLVYYGNQRQLEYDFVVAPGADPKRIVLGFKGAERLEIDAQGELVLHTAGGDIRQHKPVIYQEVDGVRREIAGGYVRKGANRVGFKVAAYDASRPLIIDPVLSYSTYLGGSGYGSGNGVAVDAKGNAYVTGVTGGINFPTTPGAFQPSSGSGVFVTKFNPAGSALVYSTYFGGTAAPGSLQGGIGIAVDGDGNAYVTGITGSIDFPTTKGAFQPTNGGGKDVFGGHHDAFVTKLNATGSALIYSTYLGGDNYDQASGIAVDADGNAHVTGRTHSTNFPTMLGAFQATFGGSERDAFVTKVNPTGSALVYSSYLGGSGDDWGLGIAVDSAGNAYVTGETRSIDFPTTAGAFQPTLVGGGDAFVTKLNLTGSALVYSTFLGGGSGESGNGIAVDTGGNAYVSGSTNSSDFPTTFRAFQIIYRGDGDAFVTKLNPDGSALVYSSFLGGSGHDESSGIAVDATGNAYVTGVTRAASQGGSKDFPTTPGAFPPSGDGYDAFVTKLDPTSPAPVYSTFLGGRGGDSGNGIAVDSDGNAYVSGSTSSSDFPTTVGAFQPTFGGFVDAFVAKFSFPIRFQESAANYSGTWTSYGAETGAFSGGTILASGNAMDSASFSFIGTAVTWIGTRCNVCGTATVSIDGGPPVLVDTAGPNQVGSLTSEPVYSASGLDPAVSHTMVITVTGVTTSVQSAPFGSHIPVDAFDVTR